MNQHKLLSLSLSLSIVHSVTAMQSYAITKSRGAKLQQCISPIEASELTSLMLHSVANYCETQHKIFIRHVWGCTTKGAIMYQVS
jgi:hypothetical protein